MRVGMKSINTFALKLPRVQGRGIVVLSHLDILNLYLCYYQVLYNHLSMSLRTSARFIKGDFAQGDQGNYLSEDNISTRVINLCIKLFMRCHIETFYYFTRSAGSSRKWM